MKEHERKKRYFLKEVTIGVWIRLLRASNIISNEIRKKVGKKGVTLPQLYVLGTLGVLGDLPLGELSKQILVTKGNMTPIVDHLEKRGLVARERDLTDRRIVWVRLTPKGKELFSDIVSVYEEEFNQLLGSSLSPSQLKTLSTLLKMITDNIVKN